jgi:hypothetical protein
LAEVGGSRPMVRWPANKLVNENRSVEDYRQQVDAVWCRKFALLQWV